MVEVKNAEKELLDLKTRLTKNGTPRWEVGLSGLEEVRSAQPGLRVTWARNMSLTFVTLKLWGAGRPGKRRVLTKLEIKTPTSFEGPSQDRQAMQQEAHRPHH